MLVKGATGNLLLELKSDGVYNVSFNINNKSWFFFHTNDSIHNVQWCRYCIVLYILPAHTFISPDYFKTPDSWPVECIWYILRLTFRIKIECITMLLCWFDCFLYCRNNLAFRNTTISKLLIVSYTVERCVCVSVCVCACIPLLCTCLCFHNDVMVWKRFPL